MTIKILEEEKKCRICGIVKERDLFYKVRGNSIGSYCKPCANERRNAPGRRPKGFVLLTILQVRAIKKDLLTMNKAKVARKHGIHYATLRLWLRTPGYLC